MRMFVQKQAFSTTLLGMPSGPCSWERLWTMLECKIRVLRQATFKHGKNFGKPMEYIQEGLPGMQRGPKA